MKLFKSRKKRELTIMMKKLLSIVLTIGVAFSLSGCMGGWSESEISEFIQWNLDDVYLGEYNEDYMDMIGMDEVALDASFLEGMKMESEVFVYYFDLVAPSEQELERITNFYVELYKHSNYTVPEAVKNEDDTFTINMTIQPLLMIQEILVIAEENLTMHGTAEWNEFVIATAEAQLAKGEFNLGEVVDVPVKMSLDTDNNYVVADEDWALIDELLITY